MCKHNIFRTLRPEEIEVRVQQVSDSGGKFKANLLIYKNARIDMDMLDEYFGCLGWQREHFFKEGKNYCKVSVFDTKTQRWVSKEDVGVESNTEETKGEASDAFKRACVNFGIGRELYTAPSISIELNQNEAYSAGTSKAGKPIYRISGWVKFRVSYIGYDEGTRTINDLIIVDGNGRVRYSLKDSHKATPPMGNRQPRQKSIERKKISTDDLMDEAYLKGLCEWLHKKAQGKKLDDVIHTYYDADPETISNITNEYLRIYG